MLFLHRNENRFGLSPSVRATLQASCVDVFSYPGSCVSRLRGILARHYALPPAQVLLGAGSTEVLALALTSLSRQPGARLFSTLPVYAPVEWLARGRMPLTQLPLTTTMQADVGALRRAVSTHPGFAVVYLSHPDCYCGALLDRDPLLAWIRERDARVFFIVDEAYMEFVDAPERFSLCPAVAAGADNLLVLRTFSKAYGLAGLRIGYGLAGGKAAGNCPSLSGRLGLSLPAVTAALDAWDDHAWLLHALTLMRVSRDTLSLGLSSLGGAPLDSVANFVLHRVPGDGGVFRRVMREHAIRVGFPVRGLPGWCRVTVGAIDEVNHYLSALRTL